MEKVKPSEAASMLNSCINKRRPMIIWGDFGVGKSDVARQVAASRGMKLYDVRGSLIDAVDLRGCPYVDNGVTRWGVPSFLPQVDEPALVLLDEMNRAPMMVQNALLSLVLDRRIGEYVLPDSVAVAACCNMDGAGVSRSPEALDNRFIHCQMVVDVYDWSKWAMSNGIHPAVVAYNRFRTEHLHQVVKGQKANATPRSWSFVSDMVHEGGPCRDKLIAGAIGKPIADEFLAFLGIFSNAPNLDAILINPTGAPIPPASEPATLYAVAHGLALRSNAANFDKILVYFDRLPEEFAVFGVREAIRTAPEVQATNCTKMHCR